jgi:hypothetical protein
MVTDDIWICGGVELFGEMLDRRDLARYFNWRGWTPDSPRLHQKIKTWGVVFIFLFFWISYFSGFLDFLVVWIYAV